MLGHPRFAVHLAVSLTLAVLLVTWPSARFGVPAAAAQTAADACTVVDDDVRATTCRLVDGEAVTGALGAAGSATYRLDAFGPDATVTLTLRARGGSTTVSLLDWRGQVVASALRADDAPEASIQAQLALPGTYAVRVNGALPAESPDFQVIPSIAYSAPAQQPVWPATLASPTAALTGERQIVRTPRGGTPAGGLAVARALGAPPDGEVDDFTLVADVQFERIVGSSALTVRFRYEPEAGGGSGYILAVNPVAGTATLDAFEEGQRRPIASQVPLPFMPTTVEPNRLVLRAVGPSIHVSLDGQPVLDVTDERYPRGLIAVGVVTWSDPAAVLFDHIQVTTSVQATAPAPPPDDAGAAPR